MRVFFIYVILMFFLGITFVELLNKKKVLNRNNFNIYEIISLEMTSGSLIFVIYMLIIGFLNIKYSKLLFLPIFLNFIYVCIMMFIKFLKNNETKKFFTKKNVNIKNVLSIILFISFLVWMMYFVLVTLNSTSFFPDEYAIWLLNPKNMFIGKKMNFFINTGLEIYPNFLPLLSSGYYFFIDKIDENSVRMFSCIFMISGTLGLLGLTKRKKLNVNYVLVMILLMFIGYDVVPSLLTSLYADIPFMTTYGLGMLYLLEWMIYDRKNELLIISIVNLMCYSFIKTEAIYLLLFNILLIIIFPFVFKSIKKISLKTILVYSSLTVILPIIWKIYSIVANFPARMNLLGSHYLKLEYTISLLTNMSSQFYDCIPWVIMLTLFLTGLFIYGDKMDSDRKIYILCGTIIMLVNIAFLILCYLTVFGAEAITAASFIRYITRLYIIMIIISLVSISNFFYNK